MAEIDLLKNYPRTKRDINKRGHEKTEADIAVARMFGKEFFDGDRRTGYGGFQYNPKFWQPTIRDFIDRYNLTSESKLLDIGCAKGFMIYDFVTALPGLKVSGIDISAYAIENAKNEIKPYLQVADARELPFDDQSFDLVISINTLHNLEISDIEKAINEIKRVSRCSSYITVDAYRNQMEKEAMFNWNLTAKTIMSVEEWTRFFKEVAYNGDYYWFTP